LNHPQSFLVLWSGSVRHGFNGVQWTGFEDGRVSYSFDAPQSLQWVRKSQRSRLSLFFATRGTTKAVVGARRRANGIPTIVSHCSCFQGVFNVYDAATHCNRPEKRNLRHLASLLKNGQTAGPSGRRNNPQMRISCEPPPRISGGVCKWADKQRFIPVAC